MDPKILCFALEAKFGSVKACSLTVSITGITLTPGSIFILFARDDRRVSRHNHSPKKEDRLYRLLVVDKNYAELQLNDDNDLLSKQCRSGHVLGTSQHMRLQYNTDN